MIITIKRIYEPFSAEDGCRILVDRLWPRGQKKADAHIDIWMKDVAPSSELRKWFNHDPERWTIFQKKYTAELKASGAVDELMTQVRKQEKLTLLYAAKDEDHTHALVLLHYMKTQLR